MEALFFCLLFFSLSLAKEDDLELPLCPLNVEYFPQELPMHCRMPRNADNQMYNLPDAVEENDDKVDKRQVKRKATIPPEYSYFESPSPDKLPPPVPFPVPPFPLPGMPGPPAPGLQFPGSIFGMPGSIPGMQGSPAGMPGPNLGMPVPIPGMPGALPMPMPIPGAPPHKMPIIVMPFYSQDRRNIARLPRRDKHRKKHHHHESSDADLSSEEIDDASHLAATSDEGWWKMPKKNSKKKKKGHKNYGIYRRFKGPHIIKKKKNSKLLTPILQYVTKDGYVIFEKKITNNEANSWLGPKDGAMAIKEVKMNEKVRRMDNDGDNFTKLEINEKKDLKTEAEESDNNDSEKYEMRPVKIREAEDSRETNEINESPITEKHRKKKMTPLIRHG